MFTFPAEKGKKRKTYEHHVSASAPNYMFKLSVNAITQKSLMRSAWV